MVGAGVAIRWHLSGRRITHQAWDAVNLPKVSLGGEDCRSGGHVTIYPTKQGVWGMMLRTSGMGVKSPVAMWLRLPAHRSLYMFSLSDARKVES